MNNIISYEFQCNLFRDYHWKYKNNTYHFVSIYIKVSSQSNLYYT